MDQVKSRTRATLQSIAETRILGRELRRKSNQADESVSRILMSYVMSVPVDLIEQTPDENSSVEEVSGKNLSTQSRGNKPSSTSSSKQISMLSMLRRNLTANDDVRRRSSRKETENDLKFDPEDAKIKSRGAVTDAKRRRNIRAKGKVQETR